MDGKDADLILERQRCTMSSEARVLGKHLRTRFGSGDQDILFLHTAGSDGRQYHGVGRVARSMLIQQVMNDPRLLERDLRMTVFDLPSHGRSFPPFTSLPGSHFNSEDRYIEVIGAIIKKLGLRKTIVSQTCCEEVHSSETGVRRFHGRTHLSSCCVAQRRSWSICYYTCTRMRVRPHPRRVRQC